MKRYRTTVRTLRRPPWSMQEAADYLEEWLDGAESRCQGSAEVPPPCDFFIKMRTPNEEVGGAAASWSNFSAKPPKFLAAKEQNPLGNRGRGKGRGRARGRGRGPAAAAVEAAAAAPQDEPEEALEPEFESMSDFTIGSVSSAQSGGSDQADSDLD